MALSAGIRLGSYEVMDRVGVGGMGEVYRAHDHNLGREVALKVLPDTLARDEQQRARLEREARLLASLNHPNIASIHDLGTEGDLHYLVLELVPGKTLAQRLEEGRLLREDALSFALQIAEALQAAHERGIIHRDLKPSNIKITPEGRVKVLDFGLARVAVVREPGVDEADLPTSTLSHSEEGFLHGTPGYMSPEQVRGQDLDRRTDIWAFGCVMYEMLCGQKAFPGPTLSDRMAATLTREPDWSPLAGNRSSLERNLLRACLERSAEKRPQAMEHILEALRRDADERREPGRAGFRHWGWVAAGLLAGVGLVLVWMGLGYRGEEKTDARYLEAKGEQEPRSSGPRLSQLTSRKGVEEFPAWSPDGKQLAFSAQVGKVRKIFLKNLETGTEKTFTEGASDDIQPAWSPDGRSILFVRARKAGHKLEPGDVFGVYDSGDIWRKALKRGEETLFLEEAFNPAYSPQGNRIAVDASWVGPRRIWTVDTEGRNPNQVTSDQSEAVDHFRPRWSPDGRRITFQSLSRTQFDIRIVDLESGEMRWITHDEDQDLHPVFSAGGDAIFFSSYRSGGLNIWRTDLSPAGDLMGRMRQITTGSGQDVQPVLTVDGQRLAFTILRQNADLWKLPVSPGPGMRIGPPVPVAASTREDSRGAWSPDGRRIAFNSDRGGQMNIWALSIPDGSVERLTDGPGGDFQPRWAPDGSFIAFFSSRSGNADIWVLDVATKAIRQITQDPAIDLNPAYSPDGKWIAFQSDRGGHLELWVMGADGSAPRVLTKHGVTGHFLRWSRDGRYLYFRSRTGPNQPVLRVPLEGGKPQEVGEIVGGSHISFSPDQTRILDVMGHKELWISSLHSGPPVRLFAFEEQEVRIDYPVWSPDGTWILFDRFQPEGGDIWVMESLP